MDKRHSPNTRAKKICEEYLRKQHLYLSVWTAPTPFRLPESGRKPGRPEFRWYRLYWVQVRDENARRSRCVWRWGDLNYRMTRRIQALADSFTVAVNDEGYCGMAFMMDDIYVDEFRIDGDMPIVPDDIGGLFPPGATGGGFGTPV